MREALHQKMKEQKAEVMDGRHFARDLACGRSRNLWAEANLAEQQGKNQTEEME